jgi:hypothetical protein
MPTDKCGLKRLENLRDFAWDARCHRPVAEEVAALPTAEIIPYTVMMICIAIYVLDSVYVLSNTICQYGSIMELY